MIGDDDRASGKLTTSGTGPPSRRIGLRKYRGKLNLFCIESGISRENAISRDARNCGGRNVIHRNTGAPDDRCTTEDLGRRMHQPSCPRGYPPSLSAAPPYENGAKIDGQIFMLNDPIHLDQRRQLEGHRSAQSRYRNLDDKQTLLRSERFASHPTPDDLQRGGYS